MQRTPIEWVRNPDGTQGYTRNLITGKCPHNCKDCYAEAIRRRFKLPEKMQWHPERLQEISTLKKPSTIFMGSMYDLFGSWVPLGWQVKIIKTVKEFPQHTFLFLTKNPKRYYGLDIPLNYWLGGTVDIGMKANSVSLKMVGLNIKNKFLSAEPLLGDIADYVILNGISWLIIGCLNRNGRPVKPEKGGTRLEWVYRLIEQAEQYKIPIFLKDKLLQLYPELSKLGYRQLPYLKGVK